MVIGVVDGGVDFGRDCVGVVAVFCWVDIGG